MMTFVSDSRNDAANLLLATSEQYVAQSADENAAAMRDAGLPICIALADFHDERYSACVDQLLPIRSKLDLLGGSQVQRNLIASTMLEAALRAGRFALALGLANERCELKPTSPQHWLDVARACEGLGRTNMAQKANAKAQALTDS
jgi:hypothetical protein